MLWKHICSLIIGTDYWVQVLAWSSIAQSVCQRAFSLLGIWCLRHWVRILHWAEEGDLSPFDSKIACLIIEVNNKKHVYHQRRVQRPTRNRVEWAECSLIIGTGYWVQVLAWFSTAQSVCQRVFSLLAIWCLRPWVRILYWAEEGDLSPFDSKITCLCQSIEIYNNIHYKHNMRNPHRYGKRLTVNVRYKYDIPIDTIKYFRKI